MFWLSFSGITVDIQKKRKDTYIIWKYPVRIPVRVMCYSLLYLVYTGQDKLEVLNYFQWRFKM